jgi:hypothetical protein
METSSNILKKAKFDCSIDGLIAITTMEYEFTNPFNKDIESIYTVPLPTHITFISLTVELRGEKYQGRIEDTFTANEEYEESIEQGKTPILFRKIDEIRYQLNCGRIKPNEDIKITLKVAEILQPIGDFVRYFLPTIIAPLYNDYLLDEWDRTHNSMYAEYSYKMDISIKGLLSKSKISALGLNNLVIKNDDNIINLSFSGYLDQDIMINMEDIEIKNQKYIAKNENFSGYCIAEQLKESDKDKKNFKRNITILADCSGSMAGDSIKQLRKSIRLILENLNKGDKVRVLKFGTKFEWLNKEPILAKTPQMRYFLRDNISRINSNMYGTELFGALEEAYKEIKQEEGYVNAVLLISDVQFYHAGSEEIISQIRDSKTPLFAVGVGTSSLVRSLNGLCRDTGGDTMELSPYEPMAQRMLSFLDRIGYSVNNKIDLKNTYTYMIAKFVGEYNFKFYEEENLNEIKDYESISKEHSSALSQIILQNKYETLEEKEQESFAIKNSLLTDKTSLIVVAGETPAKHEKISMPKTLIVEHMNKASVSRDIQSYEICYSSCSIENYEDEMPEFLEYSYDSFDDNFETTTEDIMDNNEFKNYLKSVIKIKLKLLQDDYFLEKAKRLLLEDEEKLKDFLFKELLLSESNIEDREILFEFIKEEIRII